MDLSNSVLHFLYQFGSFLFFFPDFENSPIFTENLKNGKICVECLFKSYLHVLKIWDRLDNQKVLCWDCFDAGVFLGQKSVFSLQIYLKDLDLEFFNENLCASIIWYVLWEYKIKRGTLIYRIVQLDFAFFCTHIDWVRPVLVFWDELWKFTIIHRKSQKWQKLVRRLVYALFTCPRNFMSIGQPEQPVPVILQFWVIWGLIRTSFRFLCVLFETIYTASTYSHLSII